jgi:hypothetical protein
LDFNTFDEVTDGLLFTHEELDALRTAIPGPTNLPVKNVGPRCVEPHERTQLQCEIRVVEREGLVMPNPLTSYRVPTDMLDITKFAGDVSDATSNMDAATEENVFEKMQGLMKKCKKGEI